MIYDHMIVYLLLQFSVEEMNDSADRSASASLPAGASALRSSDDFEDIVPRPDADDSQPISPSVGHVHLALLISCPSYPLAFRTQEELRMRALLTLLPGESGLDAQSFRCSRCNAPLEIHTGTVHLLS